MRFISCVVAAVAAHQACAAPVAKCPGIDDGVILNYALTLEFLERSFYRTGLANFTQAAFVAAGFADPFYDNLLSIYEDEKTHVDFLVAALTKAGVVPTQELQYTFPVTDAAGFVALSSVLEGVGVSAYSGAASSIENPDSLTAAATILGIEARHASYIRASLKEKPFPIPFETPLDFNSVFSLAAPFITGGSSPVTLPFKAFPPVKAVLSPADSVAKSSSSITFTAGQTNAAAFDPAITADTPIYAVFFSGLDKLPVQVHTVAGTGDYKIDQVPMTAAGQVYVVLSRSNTDFGDANIIAGPSIFEVVKS